MFMTRYCDVGNRRVIAFYRIGLYITRDDFIFILRLSFIISFGFIVSGVSVTCSGALEGLGKGTASLVISLCRYTVVILPIAVVLCRIMGANGVWHAFWVTEFISAGVALVAWKRV